MNPEIPIISSKKLKSLQPLLYVIIDGANLVEHTSMPRMLVKTDTIELQYKKMNPAEINMEELFNTLLTIQGTALNLAGYQRVYIRTNTNLLIQLDPRLSIPFIFNDFLKMFYLFSKDGLVKSDDDATILMKYVKSDIGKFIPPGVPRYSLFIQPKEDKSTSLKDFIFPKTPIAVYVHLDPEQPSYDELMQNSYCISNDNLTSATILNKVVHEIECQNDF